MSAVEVTVYADEQLSIRLAQECAKLDPEEKQALADEGLAAERDQ